MLQQKFKNKEVLLVGLGILGGGLGTARFLLKQGAKLTITDKREKNILQPTINKLPKGIRYTLGTHKKEDFENADFVVVNPAVPRYGEWVQYAEKIGKKVFNDLTLFLESFPKNKSYVAITGTRGKTTTTLWVQHFLKNSIIGGNIPESGPLAIINKKGNPFVLELSSFQLEYMNKGILAPHIALITNLYQDHLNRHKTMEEYAKAKASLFLNQNSDDFLVLNNDNSYTKHFLSLKPRSRVMYISLKPLAKGKNGLFVKNNTIIFVENGIFKKILQSPFSTDFENQNLMGALLVAYLYTKEWKKIIPLVKLLPQAPMRRELILKKKNLVVINDSAGTSPDATVALLSAFVKTPRTQKLLITGGTDKQLDFKEWAKTIKKEINKENLFFIEGSATIKMIEALKKNKYFSKNEVPVLFSTLQDIVNVVKVRKGSKTILFSPSSASFEKFKNEFDRGNQFTKLITKHF